MSSPQLPAHSEGQSEILEGLHYILIKILPIVVSYIKNYNSYLFTESDWDVLNIEDYQHLEEVVFNDYIVAILILLWCGGNIEHLTSEENLQSKNKTLCTFEGFPD